MARPMRLTAHNLGTNRTGYTAFPMEPIGRMILRHRARRRHSQTRQRSMEHNLVVTDATINKELPGRRFPVPRSIA